ncbi:5-oxoprolinase subunit PxpB [Falsiroseomonas ponticola]|jgi:KipI family sensor histidine kinase inhibitor|uniref:5-oxoprolinase subunit PxpB n=1 Tax=Falsiroseomonas ponticola TaxID=2786951 RepID=UPI00193356ED|nr:5-oxoprolinase subunit PxpB [Roseomonas ponticola]
MSDDPQLSLLGTTALLFEAPGETTLEAQRRIWALAREAAAWPEVGEAVPGMNNVMVTFARPPRDWAPLAARLRQAWQAIEPLPLEGRCVELPVVYGGEGGPHMADVVAHTALTPEQIAEIHAAPTYPVFAVGSHPGYCYLGGMDPRIATPRRRTPVLRIPGGAVSIGGAQTGVSASPGPSGWNTIGSTGMVFFDLGRMPPTLLQPGDSIRFRIARVLR